jgi:uncharacterized membrane protein
VKPLVVLLVTFVVVLFITRTITDTWNFVAAGNLAMSVMLAFTAVGHFIYTEGMMMMLPSAIPYKRQVIILTGILEFMAAIGLQITSLQRLTGILLIIFFALVLPANIYAAMHSVNYQKATRDGSGSDYLLFRIPLQLLFILWVWYFAIRPLDQSFSV